MYRERERERETETERTEYNVEKLVALKLKILLLQEILKI